MTHDPLTGIRVTDDDPGPSPLIRTLRPVVITVVLAVLVLGGFASISHLVSDTRTETGELDLGDAGQLTLRVGSADVRLVQGDVEVPRYEARVTSGLADTAFEVGRVGDVIRVEAGCRTLLSPGCGVDLTVIVPEGLDVDVEASSGDIDLAGLAGVVTIRTGAGDVEGDAVQAQDLTVVSGAGDVDVTFASQPFAVKVTTREGDVELGLPEGGVGYAVDARSESGEVESAFGASDDAQARAGPRAHGRRRRRRRAVALTVPRT